MTKKNVNIEKAENHLVAILKKLPLNSCEISKIMDAVSVYSIAHCNNHMAKFVKPLLLERFKIMIQDL